MKKTLCIILSLLMVAGLLTLTGCGARVSNKEASAAVAAFDGDFGYTTNSEPAEYDEDFYSKTKTADNKSYEQVIDTESTDSGDILDGQTRKLVRNADLTVETKTFDAFVGSLEKKVREFNGYIESSSTNAGGYFSKNAERFCSVTVRIPAEKFDSFIDSLSDNAKITSKSISVSDITSNYIDTESRIKALEAEQKALMGILEKAESVSDTLEVYSQLSEVNAKLESCKSTMKTYDSLVAYSTISISIDEVEHITEEEKEGFFAETFRRLKENIYSIGSDAKDFAIWFISSLPYILIFAVVVFFVVKITVRIRRKKKAKKAKKAKAESENN